MNSTTHVSSQAANARATHAQAQDAAEKVGAAVARHSQDAAEHLFATPAKDILGQLRQYAREKPDVAICWSFALGVVVGWKLRS